MIRYGLIERTPLGPIWVAISETGAVALDYHDEEAEFRKSIESITDEPVQRDQSAIWGISQQLKEYFDGKEPVLKIDIDWQYFNDFQKKVLQVVAGIPAGSVKTYGQIAEEIGLDKAAARAVGRANATNPIPIIIPCHRVIGANGALTGYGGPGGVKTKAWLLELEGYSAGYQEKLDF